MGCSTYLGLGWRYQPLAPGHPTSICDIGVNLFSASGTSPRRPGAQSYGCDHCVYYQAQVVVRWLGVATASTHFVKLH